MPPDLPILSERSLSEPLSSVMRPYRDCCTVANPRTVMDRALEQGRGRCPEFKKSSQLSWRRHGLAATEGPDIQPAAAACTQISDL